MRDRVGKSPLFSSWRSKPGLEIAFSCPASDAGPGLEQVFSHLARDTGHGWKGPSLIQLEMQSQAGKGLLSSGWDAGCRLPSSWRCRARLERGLLSPSWRCRAKLEKGFPSREHGTEMERDLSSSARWCPRHNDSSGREAINPHSRENNQTPPLPLTTLEERARRAGEMNGSTKPQKSCFCKDVGVGGQLPWVSSPSPPCGGDRP